MPVLEPHLPAEWTHLHFSIRAGGAMLRVEIDHESVSVRSEEGAKVDIEIMGERHTIDSAGCRVEHA